MRAIMITVCALVALGRLTPLQAQQPHEGFWSGFAPGGAGWVELPDSSGFSERFGYPFYLRLGGTLNPRVLLGIEAYSVIWNLPFNVTGPSSDYRASYDLTAIALLYPSPNAGLFIKPGVGISATGAGTGTTIGFGSTLGVGYDVRVRRSVYLTPNVDVLMLTIPFGPPADLRIGYFFTLGVTWH